MTADRKLFICYRRADQRDFVERIRDWLMLQGKYKRENVFMDFDSIPLFVTFEAYIKERIEEVDILLPIFGPDWSTLRQTKEQNQDKDYVAIEMIHALQHGKLIAPICIKGAEMPRKNILPDILHPILEINAAHLEGGSHFLDTMPKIIQGIENAIERHEQLTAGLKATLEKTETPEDAANKLSEVLSSPKTVQLLYQGRVTVPGLRVRQLPGIKSPILSMLPENTQVNVLALDDSQEWAQIIAADGATGWVSTKFLVDVLSR
jgi:hypothetical protein